MGVNCIDYSTMAVTDTAKTLSTSASPEMPPQTHGAIITIETDQVRFRTDGTDADSTVGNGDLLNVGDVLTFDSWTTGVNWRSVLQKISFHRVTADAALSISWYD